MDQQNALKSDALAANLQETRTGKIEIPENHQAFRELSIEYYSIHARAVDCLNEYNHPFSNSGYVIGQLRNIALGDFWFYDKHEKAAFAWDVVLGLFEGIFERVNTPELGEDAVHSLLELAEKLLQSESDREQSLIHLLTIIENSTAQHPVALILNSTFMQRVFTRGDWPGQSREKAFEVLRNVLILNAN